MSERIVDLSLSFKQGMRGVDYATVATIPQKGYQATDLKLYSHAGTHLDAPSHSIEGAGTVDQIELSKCIGPALVIDMSHKASNSLISVEDLQPYTDQISAGSRLLIRTDWDDHAEQGDYRTDFPRISLQLAEWLAERGISLLGLETPSVASLQDKQEMMTVHRAILSNEIVIVESLTNLRHLTQQTVYFVALPLKIHACDGSPVRAIAIENKGLA